MVVSRGRNQAVEKKQLENLILDINVLNVIKSIRNPDLGLQNLNLVNKVVDSIQQPKTKFLRVRCNDCGNEQVIFGAPSAVVKCIVCEKVLAQPKGGKGSIKTKILEVLG